MITDDSLKFQLHECITTFENFRTTFKMIMYNIALLPFQKIRMILKWNRKLPAKHYVT